MPELSTLDDAVTLIWLARDLARRKGKDPVIQTQDIQYLEPGAQVNYILKHMEDAHIQLTSFEITWLDGLVRSYRARGQLIQQYVPKMCLSPIVLFRATQMDPHVLMALDESHKAANFRPPDLQNEWSRLSSQPIDVHEISAYHIDMVLEPAVNKTSAPTLRNS